MALSQNFLSSEWKHHYAGCLLPAPEILSLPWPTFPSAQGGWCCRNVFPLPLASSWLWPTRSPGGRPEEGRRRSRCSSEGIFPMGLPLAGCIKVIAPLTVVCSDQLSLSKLWKSLLQGQRVSTTLQLLTPTSQTVGPMGFHYTPAALWKQSL